MLQSSDGGVGCAARADTGRGRLSFKCHIVRGANPGLGAGLFSQHQGKELKLIKGK